MTDDEFWSHGPASLLLLIERQSQRDNLHKLCAGTIAAANPWLKDVKPETFFPELIPPKTPEEIKEEQREQFERQKSIIANKAKNAKRRSDMEGRRTKAT